MSPSLSDVFEEFVIYMSAETSKINVKNYQYRLKTFLDKYGRRPIGLLSPKHADQWRLSLITERQLAPKSVYGYTQCLQKLDRFIVDRYPDAYRPIAAHIKNKQPKPRIGKKLPNIDDVMTLKETAVALIADPPDLQYLRDAVIVLWLIETGCRRSEVSALETRLMGLNQPYVEVVNGVGVNVYEARLPHAKTDSDWDEEQTVDYLEPLAAALRKWLEYRPPTDRNGKRYHHLFVGVGDCGRHRKKENTLTCWVCRHYGMPMTSSAIRFALANIVDRAGVSHISPHQLRHAFGQRALDTSNAEIARQRLRHKDIRVTTMFYGHQDKGRRRRGAVVGSLLIDLEGSQEP